MWPFKSKIEQFFDAVNEGNAGKVKEFIDNGVRLETRSKAGGTALHHACHAGQIDVVKVLLEKGADVNSQADINRFAAATVFGVTHTHIFQERKSTEGGCTPLILASSVGHADVVKVLLAHPDIKFNNSILNIPRALLKFSGFQSKWKEIVELLEKAISNK